MKPEQTAKKRRKWLDVALDEMCQVAQADAAIRALEMMHLGAFQKGMIARLKKEQQRAFKAINRAAEKLEASFEAS